MTAFNDSEIYITTRRTGTLSDPYISRSESKKINLNEVHLTELPSELDGVVVTGNSITWVETKSANPTVDQYYVDYINGYLVFHPSREGLTVTIDYFGRGITRISAGRVFSETDGNGNVAQTLQDIIGAGSGSWSFKGQYNSSTNYVTNNVVTYNGNSYICLLNSTGNVPTNTTYWSLFVASGSITNVSSSNSDISVANPTTSPVLTLNAGAGANQIVKRNATGTIDDVDAVQTIVDDHEIQLSSSNLTSLVLQPGVNIYNDITRMTRLMGLKMTGRTLVNLLGRDGNCEDVSKISVGRTTVSAHTTNKVYGNQSASIVATATVGTHYARLSNGNKIKVEPNAYYIAIAEIDAYSAGYGRITIYNQDVSNVTISQIGGNIISGNGANFALSHAKFQAPSNVDGVLFEARILNASQQESFTATGGEFIYIDGARLYKITQTEYNALDTMTADQIAAKYPYVDDMKHVNAVYARNPGKNLLPPFSEWTLHANAVVTETYKMTLNATAIGQASYVDFACAPSTTYTLSVGGSVPLDYRLRVYEDGVNKDTIHSGMLTYTWATGANAKSIRVIADNNAAGTFTFTNPMLNIGSTALSFEPQQPSYTFMPDVQARSNVDGTVTDQVYMDGEGKPRINRRFHEMVLDGSLAWAWGGDYTGHKRVLIPVTANAQVPTTVKYDGKTAKVDGNANAWNAADQVYMDGASFHITIADTDSGWGESYTPTSDEIKAYFYGWRMQNNDGTPYTTGTKYWRPYKGDGSLDMGVSASTVTPITSATGYTPYRLMYQLTQSVDEAVNHEGELFLHDGANQIEMGTGLVLREVVKPLDNGVGTSYDFNNTSLGNPFKYRVDKIVRLFKDTEKVQYGIYSTGQSYGKMSAYIPAYNFDQTAAYSVTYLALDTYALGIAPLSIVGEYAPNIKEAVDNLVRGVAEAKTAISVLQSVKSSKQQPQWIQPTLLNAWIAYSGSTVPPRYLKSDLSTVFLEGATTGGTIADGTTLFYLPVGYRPKLARIEKGHYYDSSASTYKIVSVNIETDGRVRIYGVTGTVLWLSLGGISFQAEQ